MTEPSRDIETEVEWTDEARFDATFRKYYGDVRRFLDRRCLDSSPVDDLLAETFLVAWRRRDQMPAEPLPWLYGVARRVLANHRRAERNRGGLRRRLEADPTTYPTQNTTDETASDLVSSAFDELSDRDQEVLRLHVWEDLSAQDAARVLGCSTATYAVRLHRARKRLASKIDLSKRRTNAVSARGRAKGTEEAP